MKTLRERIDELLRTIGSPVEKSAYDELPTRAVVVSGAVAGLLAVMSLLAIAHLGDVIVLRHYYAFLIGYIYTIFSSIGLIVIHTIVGAAAAYVYLRAEEFLGSGQWLALACFFPLFASTGTFVAERLTEAAGLGMLPSAPVLRIVLTVLATLAMTWLFWFPWLSFYRIWLTRYMRRHRTLQQPDEVKAPESMPRSGAVESSRSYIRIRREIALIRKHRSSKAEGEEFSGLGRYGELSLGDLSPEVNESINASVDTRSGGRQSVARPGGSLKRRAGLVGAVLLVVLVVAMLAFNWSLPGALRGVTGHEGVSGSNHSVRIWVKAAGLDPALVEELANEALSRSGSDTVVDAVDINQFSILAVRTIMFDGMSDVVISTREELREMADQGMLVDLSPLIERDQVYLDTFVDACIAELSAKDTVFGLPLSTSPLLLYINTKSLSYTDLASRMPPVLWTDLLEYSKALTWFTNPGGTPVVSQLGFAPTSSMWRTWLQLASDTLLSGSSIALPPSPSDPEVQDMKDSTVVPDEWRLLVDLASSLRATTLPDDATGYRNPFYERQHDPGALFASGQLAMVIADHRLHTVLSKYYPDLEYAVADIPVPDWKASGVALSDGFGMGVLRPGSDSPNEAMNCIEASWQAVKTVATDPDIQAQIAENAGLLPGLESLFNHSVEGSMEPNLRPRDLSQGDEEIEGKFRSSQLRAVPVTGQPLPSSSLTRIYRLLDRLVQGAESVPYVLEQIEMTVAPHSR